MLFSHWQGWLGTDHLIGKSDGADVSMKDTYCINDRKRAKNELADKLNREPTEDELTKHGYPPCERIKVYKCSRRPYQIMRFGMTILFPPMSVFMVKGITGWVHIIICCVLTAMFYFPGMAYAFIIMNGSKINVCDVIQ